MNNPILKNGLWFKNGKLYTGILTHRDVAGFPNGLYRTNIKNGLKEGLTETFISNEQLWRKEYYKEGKLPQWEVPNIITKYHTTTRAYKKALEQ